jgi:hypothetical protein
MQLDLGRKTKEKAGVPDPELHPERHILVWFPLFERNRQARTGKGGYEDFKQNGIGNQT